MRVSIFVMLSLVGMSMGQGVRFRDSMLGHILSDTVSAGRASVGDVMGIFSTIGQGMTKMIVPNGSRRKNNRIRPNNPAQFRQSAERDSGLRPQGNSGSRPFRGDSGPRPLREDSGPRPVDLQDEFIKSGPRPQQQQRFTRPQLQRLRKKQQRQQHQEFDGVQRLSGNEILGLANPQTNFRNRQQQLQGAFSGYQPFIL